MSRSIIPVPALALALALAALAGLPAPRSARAHEMQVLQGGENFEVQWTGGPRDTLAGGGVARMEGGGDDLRITYEPQSTRGQSTFATMSGGGVDRSFTRSAPVPADTMVAQAPTASGQALRR